MKNIIISIFDDKFIDYAIKMYGSVRFFDKETPLFAGSINLSVVNKNKLKNLGVTVLQSRNNFFPKHLCMCDLLLEDFLYNVNFDSVMWIDADTIILRPIKELFDLNYDYIGHGGNIDLGYFENFNKFSAPNIKRSWIKRTIVDGNLVQENLWGKHYAMGLWVAKNKKILKDFCYLIYSNKDFWFEGDICSKLLNENYNCLQLNGFEWALGTRNNHQIFFENNKVVFKSDNKLFYPYSFSYSRLDNGDRPLCNAVELFYNKRTHLLS